MFSRIRLPYVLAALGAVMVVTVLAVALTSTGVVMGSERKEPFIDDGSDLVNEATIPLDTAIAIAQSVATGPLDNEVDLEREGDRLVYEIELGDTEVRVDANDGTVVKTDVNDDANDADDDDDDQNGEDDD